jgi:uncharacterized protein (DUF2141 family)
VLVAVCTPETFLGRSCPYAGRAPAASGQAQVVVRGIDPGVYGVQAFHDQNDNFDLDRNFLGLPKEGMGFSNDAPCGLDRRALMMRPSRSARPALRSVCGCAT